MATTKKAPAGKTPADASKTRGHGGELHQSIAWLPTDVAIHVDSRGGIVVRLVAANRRIDRAVALIDSMLAVVIGFVLTTIGAWSLGSKHRHELWRPVER